MVAFGVDVVLGGYAMGTKVLIVERKQAARSQGMQGNRAKLGEGEYM